MIFVEFISRVESIKLLYRAQFKEFFVKFKFAIFIFIFLISIPAYYVFTPLKFQSESQIIDVYPGRSFFQIGSELKKKNLIKSELAFKFLVALSFYPPLHLGEYQLSASESLWSQFQKLKKGQFVYKFVTFQEGLNTQDILHILKQKKWSQIEEFERLLKDKAFIKEVLNEDISSFEGYLFPDTYKIQKYTSAKVFLKKMVSEFLKAYNEVKGKTPIPLSRHQLVTLASLVEKETGDARERPLIASVFYNRLKIGMKLQTDPTILYSLFLHQGVMPKNIRKKDILFPSSYNTYVIKGLPPGPIASPGKAALRACFFPSVTQALYFVSRNDGTHVFSKTYKEHKKAVYKYQVKSFLKNKKVLRKNQSSP